MESHADPKGALLDALLEASQLRGRRRDQFKRDFGRHRALLLERLDRDGLVKQLAAWQQLKDDIAAALQEVATTEPGRRLQLGLRGTSLGVVVGGGAVVSAEPIPGR